MGEGFRGHPGTLGPIYLFGWFFACVWRFACSLRTWLHLLITDLRVAVKRGSTWDLDATLRKLALYCSGRSRCSRIPRLYAKLLAGLGPKSRVADLNLLSYEEFQAEAKDMTADSTVAGGWHCFRDRTRCP